MHFNPTLFISLDLEHFLRITLIDVINVFLNPSKRTYHEEMIQMDFYNWCHKLHSWVYNWLLTENSTQGFSLIYFDLKWFSTFLLSILVYFPVVEESSIPVWFVPVSVVKSIQLPNMWVLCLLGVCMYIQNLFILGWRLSLGIFEKVVISMFRVLHCHLILCGTLSGHI